MGLLRHSWNQDQRFGALRHRSRDVRKDRHGGGPRLAANSIVVAKATPEKIDAATATLRSMKEGRNYEVFMAGLALSWLGLSPTEIEAELFAVVGSEPHMKRKIPGVIWSLRKYGRW